MSDMKDKNVSQIPMQSDLTLALRSALELWKLGCSSPEQEHEQPDKKGQEFVLCCLRLSSARV